MFPKAECGNCNKIVCDLINNGEKSTRILPAQDYDETLERLLARTWKRTRPIKNCWCFICKIVKENRFSSSKAKKNASQDSEPKEQKKCQKCHSIISPGKHKSCGRNERVNNLMQIVSPKTRMKLCLETIKDEQKDGTYHKPYDEYNYQ